MAQTSENGEPAFKHVMLVYKTFEAPYDFLRQKVFKNITMYQGLTKLPLVTVFPYSIETRTDDYVTNVDNH